MAHVVKGNEIVELRGITTIAHQIPEYSSIGGTAMWMGNDVVRVGNAIYRCNSQYGPSQDAPSGGPTGFSESFYWDQVGGGTGFNMAEIDGMYQGNGFENGNDVAGPTGDVYISTGAIEFDVPNKTVELMPLTWPQDRYTLMSGWTDFSNNPTTVFFPARSGFYGGQGSSPVIVDDISTGTLNLTFDWTNTFAYNQLIMLVKIKNLSGTPWTSTNINIPATYQGAIGPILVNGQDVSAAPVNFPVPVGSAGLNAYLWLQYGNLQGQTPNDAYEHGIFGYLPN